MYHEEQAFGGILCYRTTPNSDWIEFTREQLTAKLLKARAELDARPLEDLQALKADHDALKRAAEAMDIQANSVFNLTDLYSDSLQADESTRLTSLKADSFRLRSMAAKLGPKVAFL